MKTLVLFVLAVAALIMVLLECHVVCCNIYGRIEYDIIGKKADFVLDVT